MTGTSLDYLDSPIELEGLLPPPEPVSREPATEPVADDRAAGIVQEESNQSGDEPADWRSAGLWFGLLNLILLTTAGGVYWWLRKQDKIRLVRLVDDEQSAAQDAPEAQAI